MFRPVRILVLAVGLAGAAFAASEEGIRDLPEALDRLGSDSAVERWRAERWLAVNLTPESYAGLARAAEAGDAELRGRLALALGREDRHFELAVLFAGERKPALFELGRQALGDQVSRHAEELFAPPARGRLLNARLTDLDDQVRAQALDLEPFTTLGEALDRIGRLGGAALPIVTDPELEVDRLVPAVTGTWEQLVSFLTREAGAALEGHALGDPGDLFPFGFLRICRRRDAGARSGAELLMQWAVDSRHHPSPDRRAGAARALADAGWPTALAWLGQRWEATRDEAARAGICRAAARGRVVRPLVDADALRELLGEVDAQIASPERWERERALEILHALAALPPIDGRGESLAEVLLEGWEELEDRDRWTRFVVLEGMEPGDAEIARAVLSELAREGLPSGLARQGLRTLVALPGRHAAPRLADEAALFREASSTAELRELVRLLILTGAPGFDGDPADLTAMPRVALAARRLHVGDTAGAARQLVAADCFAVADGALTDAARLAQVRAAQFLGDALRSGRDAAVEAALEATAATGEAWATDRLRALLEILPAARHGALAERLATGSPVDALGWGALVGGPETARAWEVLENVLAETVAAEFDPLRADELEQGLELGLQRMLAAGEPWRVQRQLLRDLTRENAEHPLSAVLASAAWPAPPGQRPLGLRDRDRELPRDLRGE